MGNLSFIIPTENKDKFGIYAIQKMLSEEFPELILDVGNNDIAIYKDKKKTFYITTIWFNEECYLDIDEIPDLLKLKPDLKNVISMNYGMEIYTKKPYYRGQIQKFLHKYFKAYILDDGIHPDYFPPNYKWRLT